MDDQIQRIRYMKDVEGFSFRTIATELSLSRKTVAKLYAGGPAIKRAPTGSRLDEYRSLIHHWFKEHPHIRAKQIWQRLVDRGVPISRRRVEEYTVELRRKKPELYFHLEFLPGEEAQVDWFFVNHPKVGKICGFAMVMSFSRYLFAHLFPRHSFEFFVEGHLQAFRAIGGVPRALRFDNLKSVVLKRKPLTYNPAFLEFARYLGIEIRLCNPASGNEKGRVERAIRTLRDGFFNTAEHVDSLKALNMALHEWVNGKNGTLHRGTNRIPKDVLPEEKLKPMPIAPWPNCTILPPKEATKTGYVLFDTNRYSVPETCLGIPLHVRSYVDKIEIYDTKGTKLASHPRCFERNRPITSPHHRSYGRMSTQAKKDRILAVIRAMNPSVELFLAVNERLGEDAHDSALRIFRLLKLHSKQTVLSAIREAVDSKNWRIKFVISLLAPRSEHVTEEVSPQRQELLDIDFSPRELSEYEPD